MSMLGPDVNVKYLMFLFSRIDISKLKAFSEVYHTLTNSTMHLEIESRISIDVIPKALLRKVKSEKVILVGNIFLLVYFDLNACKSK